jgi:hypothetical protein
MTVQGMMPEIFCPGPAKHMATESIPQFEDDSERTPSFKLDLRYFTDEWLCPSMVRRRI